MLRRASWGVLHSWTQTDGLNQRTLHPEKQLGGSYTDWRPPTTKPTPTKPSWGSHTAEHRLTASTDEACTQKSKLEGPIQLNTDLNQWSRHPEKLEGPKQLDTADWRPWQTKPKPRKPLENPTWLSINEFNQSNLHLVDPYCTEYTHTEACMVAHTTNYVRILHIQLLAYARHGLTVTLWLALKLKHTHIIIGSETEMLQSGILNSCTSYQWADGATLRKPCMIYVMPYLDFKHPPILISDKAFKPYYAYLKRVQAWQIFWVRLIVCLTIPVCHDC